VVHNSTAFDTTQILQATFFSMATIESLMVGINTVVRSD
jgi:hypothetical protein